MNIAMRCFGQRIVMRETETEWLKYLATYGRTKYFLWNLTAHLQVSRS
jgi:hypothetical protein